MSLSVVTYLAFVIMMVLGVFLLVKNARSLNIRWIAAFLFAVAVTDAFMGAGYDLGVHEFYSESLLVIKLAGCAIYLVYFILVRFSLTFPEEKELPVADILLLTVYSLIAGSILVTDHYVIQITKVNGLFFRVEGEYYKYYSAGGLALLAASLVIFLFRRSSMKDAIHRLQVVIMVIGFSITAMVAITISIILPSIFKSYHLYPLGGIAAFICAGSIIFAVATTRFMDIRTALHNTLLFLVYSSLVGFIAAGVAVLLRLTGISGSGVDSLLVGVSFVILFALRQTLQKRLEKVFKRKTDYREDLDRELRDLDFNQEKGAFYQRFMTVLKENLGADSVTLVTENSVGELVSVGNAESRLILDKNGGLARFIMNSRKSIILESEVPSSLELASVRPELTKFMKGLNSEMLLFLKEGSALIGLIAFGQKSTLKEYNDYDYQALSGLYDRLFLVMYFIRNIEKQSIALTVNKELKVSRQIIQAIQENVDQVEIPGISVHFQSLSAMGLGGDFVDVIRLNRSRYIAVVGDIAGKGLNASMSMVILKSVIRTFIKEKGDFKNLIVKINRFVKMNFPAGTFFAGVFLLLDHDCNTVYYINCGTPLLCHWSLENESVSEIQGDGKVLGFVKDLSGMVNIRKIGFKPGEILMVTTDGILESRTVNNEAFGKEKLKSILKHNHKETSEKLVSEVLDQFMQFSMDKLNDDTTVFIMKKTTA